MVPDSGMVLTENVDQTANDTMQDQECAASKDLPSELGRKKRSLDEIARSLSTDHDLANTLAELLDVVNSPGACFSQIEDLDMISRLVQIAVPAQDDAVCKLALMILTRITILRPREFQQGDEIVLPAFQQLATADQNELDEKMAIEVCRALWRIVGHEDGVQAVVEAELLPFAVSLMSRTDVPLREASTQVVRAVAQVGNPSHHEALIEAGALRPLIDTLMEYNNHSMIKSSITTLDRILCSCKENEHLWKSLSSLLLVYRIERLLQENKDEEIHKMAQKLHQQYHDAKYGYYGSIVGRVLSMFYPW